MSIQYYCSVMDVETTSCNPNNTRHCFDIIWMLWTSDGRLNNVACLQRHSVLCSLFESCSKNTKIKFKINWKKRNEFTKKKKNWIFLQTWASRLVTSLQGKLRSSTIDRNRLRICCREKSTACFSYSSFVICWQ